MNINNNNNKKQNKQINQQTPPVKLQLKPIDEEKNEKNEKNHEKKLENYDRKDDYSPELDLEMVTFEDVDDILEEENEKRRHLLLSDRNYRACHSSIISGALLSSMSRAYGADPLPVYYGSNSLNNNNASIINSEIVIQQEGLTREFLAMMDKEECNNNNNNNKGISRSAFSKCALSRKDGGYAFDLYSSFKSRNNNNNNNNNGGGAFWYDDTKTDKTLPNDAKKTIKTSRRNSTVVQEKEEEKSEFYEKFINRILEIKIRLRRIFCILHFTEEAKERRFVIVNNSNDFQGIALMTLVCACSIYFYTLSYYPPLVWSYFFCIPVFLGVLLLRIALSIYYRVRKLRILKENYETFEEKQQQKATNTTNPIELFQVVKEITQNTTKEIRKQRKEERKRNNNNNRFNTINSKKSNVKIDLDLVETRAAELELLSYTLASWHEHCVHVYMIVYNILILFSYPNKQYCVYFHPPIEGRDCRVSFWKWSGIYGVFFIFIFISVPRLMPFTAPLVIIHTLFFIIGRNFDTTGDTQLVYGTMSSLGVVICLLVLKFLMKSEETRREKFTTSERCESYRKRAGKLLAKHKRHVQALVPPLIGHEILQTRGNLSFSYEGTIVTIRLANITRWCSERSGKEIAQEINSFYSIVDKAAMACRVIHAASFGDLYVVISGLGRFTSPAENAYRACLFASTVYEGRESKLNIAVCSGVVSGTISAKPLAYSLCGPVYTRCLIQMFESEQAGSYFDTETINLTQHRSCDEVIFCYTKALRLIKRINDRMAMVERERKEHIVHGDSPSVDISLPNHDNMSSPRRYVAQWIYGPSTEVSMFINGNKVTLAHFKDYEANIISNNVKSTQSVVSLSTGPSQRPLINLTSDVIKKKTIFRRLADTISEILNINISSNDASYLDEGAFSTSTLHATPNTSCKNKESTGECSISCPNNDNHTHNTTNNTTTTPSHSMLDYMSTKRSTELCGGRIKVYSELQELLESTRERHYKRGPLVLPSFQFENADVEKCFLEDVTIRVMRSVAVTAGGLALSCLSIGTFIVIVLEGKFTSCMWHVLSVGCITVSTIVPLFMLYCIRILKIHNAIYISLPTALIFATGVVFAPVGLLNNNMQVWSIVLLIIEHMVFPAGVMSAVMWFVVNAVALIIPLAVATLLMNVFIATPTILFSIGFLILLSYIHMQQEFQTRARFLDTILSYFLAKSFQAEILAMQEQLRVPTQALTVLETCSSIELPTLEKDEVDPLKMYGPGGRLTLLDLDLAEMKPINQGIDETTILMISLVSRKEVETFFGEQKHRQGGAKYKDPLASEFLFQLCYRVIDEAIAFHGNGKVYKASYVSGRVVLATVRDSLQALGNLCKVSQRIFVNLAAHRSDVVVTGTLAAGPIACAVVGDRCLSYQMFGDTIQTSYRLIQAAPPGSITCSDRFAFLYQCWCDEECDIWYSVDGSSCGSIDRDNNRNHHHNNNNNREKHDRELSRVTVGPFGDRLVEVSNGSDIKEGGCASYAESSPIIKNKKSDASSYNTNGISNSINGLYNNNNTDTNTDITRSNSPKRTPSGVYINNYLGGANSSGSSSNSDNNNNNMNNNNKNKDNEIFSDSPFYPPLLLGEPMPWKIKGRGVLSIRYVSVTLPQQDEEEEEVDPEKVWI